MTFTKSDTGVWVEGDPILAPTEQSYHIIKIAQRHGFEFNTENFEQAYSEIEDWDYQELEEFAELKDEAINFLQSLCDETVEFDYDELTNFVLVEVE